MPLVGFIILIVVFFAGLLFVMYKVLGAQAKQATSHLSGLNNDYLKKKEEIRKLYEESQQQAKVILKQAQRDAAKLKKESMEEIEEMKTKANNDSLNHSEQIVKDAMQARDSLKDELVQEASKMAIDKACELIKAIMTSELRQDIHKQWVDDLISNGLSEMEGVQAVEDVKEAEVVSAFELDDVQKKNIEKQLEKSLGAGIKLKETVDSSIMAGLMIKLGHLVIDGTFASKLREAALNAQNAK